MPLPPGMTNDQGNAFLEVIDDQTFETKTVYPLRDHEWATSIVSCTLADDPTYYFVVSTSTDPTEKASEGEVGCRAHGYPGYRGYPDYSWYPGTMYC